MSIYFPWQHKNDNKQYPEYVRQILHGKYARIHYHEKKIKNIKKSQRTKKRITIIPSIKIEIGNLEISSRRLAFYIPQSLSYTGHKQVHHHQYQINKIRRDIEGIKNKYNETGSL